MTDLLASPERQEVCAPGKVVENPRMLMYTRLRKSPYFWKSREHGAAVYSVYNHSYHPRHYGDPVEEYWALLEGVTLWDVGGAERQVQISGPDAFDFTNMLTPRDLSKCRVGQCKYVFLTAPDGGIINDPVLLRVGENRFWLSLADSDVLLWARGLAHAGGWQVDVREIDVAPVQVQGPKSKEVMADLLGESVREVPYYELHEYELGGLQVVVSRTGYSGEVGYEVYLHDATRHAHALWDAICQAGEPYGLRPIGPSHIRRIEGGMLAYGCDITLATNPLEVGYDYKWMVDLDQPPDFIGKDALVEAKAAGVSRLMVGVEIGGPPLGAFNDGSMIEPFRVIAGGEHVGDVTSACFSPRLERNIGLAMVPVELTERDTPLHVATPTGVHDAVVVEKPFIDPRKETPKG